MAFPRVTLGLIRQALVDGFDGLVLSSDKQLTADNNPDDIDVVSDDALPYLLFEVGSAQTAPWRGWEQALSWDIPATLKVKGASEDVDDILVEALQNIMQRTQELIGLPIDDNANVVPFTMKTARLFDEGKLQFLVERGAPFLRSFATQPSVGSYAKASLVFHVESTLDLDPRGDLPLALMVRLGILPVAPGMGGLSMDTTLPDPYGIPVAQAGDLIGYNKPVPVDPATTLRGVIVLPYAAAISAGSPTVSMSAMARYHSWHTAYVTGQAAWLSSSPSVATVSAAGLVTRVAAGTTNISCTYGGVTSNVAVITSS